MKNFIFSTTRQWNPGDELILAGVINIFAELGERYNPIIFNRNPDVRSLFQDKQLFKTSRIPSDFCYNADQIMLESNLKFGFFDNSLKPNTDCSFANWVIFAGSPEWYNGRTYDLYVNILKHNIPVMILGVGGGFEAYRPEFLEVVQKAKALIVRDEMTLDALSKIKSDVTQMACPALLSAPSSKERQIEKVKKIGLIFQTSWKDSVIWSGCSEEAYEYQIRLLHEIIHHYGNTYEFALVCHYIDDLPMAKKVFPQHEVYYSYNALDYLDIYRQFDFVVGLRVHGIGAAASVGVPGVAIQHCARGATCHGFLADVLNFENVDIPEAMHIIESAIIGAPEKSAAILRHKAQTMQSYQQTVRKALTDTQVSYSGSGFHETLLRPEMGLGELVNYLNCVLEKVEKLINYLNHVLHKSNESEKRINEFQTSTSWKITKPIRALKNLLWKKNKIDYGRRERI